MDEVLEYLIAASAGFPGRSEPLRAGAGAPGACAPVSKPRAAASGRERPPGTLPDRFDPSVARALSRLLAAR